MDSPASVSGTVTLAMGTALSFPAPRLQRRGNSKSVIAVEDIVLLDMKKPVINSHPVHDEACHHSSMDG